MAATALASVEVDRETRHRVLIAAAVAAALGGRAHILAIEPASVWALEGRARVQTSHAVFHNDGVIKIIPNPGVKRP